MQITSTSIAPKPKYSVPSEAAPSTGEQQPPSDTFTFGSSSVINAKTVAKIAGAGLGIAAGISLTGFSKGTGGVANALVGGAVAGFATFSIGAASIGNDSSDPIGHSLAVLGGGAVAAVAGGTMGALGYNFPMLVSGGLGLVGSSLAGAVVDKFTG